LNSGKQFLTPEVSRGIDTYFVDGLQWFAILNAIVLAGGLGFAVYYIMTKLVKTSDSYAVGISDVEGSDKDKEETGWKRLRVEAFKAPEYIRILSPFVGSGFHLTMWVIDVVFSGVGGNYNTRGSLITTTITIFCITAVCLGAMSSRLFNFLGGGKSWAKNVLTSALVFPAPFFLIAFVLNIFAWIQQSTAALPFSSMIGVFFIWVVSVVLAVIGGIGCRGRDEEGLAEVDKEKKYTKPIPRLPAYLQPEAMVAIAGLLIYSALFSELYFIFSSMWDHKIFTMWGSLFFIVILVLDITACVSIVFTYLQLNAQDYRWWWRSFFYGGSTAGYVFLYSLYFYTFKSEMSGFLQTTFYFGYSLVLCMVVFLVLGSVSFISSLAFVKHIYERSKVE